MSTGPDTPTPNPGTRHGREQDATLFANLVLQQSNMALMLLGKVEHPELGKMPRDLEAAQLFIDQLEMLEAKTKGNLSAEESALLKQTLMGLRLAFVQAVDSPEQPPSSPKPESPPAAAAPAAEPPPQPAVVPEPESHKKFTKKY